MLTPHPQFFKDANSNKPLVVLSTKEFDAIIEELEDIEDGRLYDEAKRNDTGERIPAEEAFSIIEANDEALIIDEIALGHRKDIYD